MARLKLGAAEIAIPRKMLQVTWAGGSMPWEITCVGVPITKLENVLKYLALYSFGLQGEFVGKVETSSSLNRHNKENTTGYMGGWQRALGNNLC